MINGLDDGSMLPFLKDSVMRLNKAGVTFIVIPCNTAHIFIEELRKASRAPIVSIVDETAAALRRRGFGKIGILATSGTVNSQIFTASLADHGITVMTPKKREQECLNRIILGILGNVVTRGDKKELIGMADAMLNKGAEAILLACTDLQNIVEKGDVNGAVMDTFEILLDSTFRRMVPFP